MARKKATTINIENPDFIKCTDELLKHLKQTMIEVIEQAVPQIEKTDSFEGLKNLNKQINSKLDEAFKMHSEQVWIINKNFKIKTLNEKETLTEADLHGLIVGGGDSFSHLSVAEIYQQWESINPDWAKETFDKIQIAFGANLKLKSRAMKWVCRGLKTEHAIAKIQFDVNMYGDN